MLDLGADPCSSSKACRFSAAKLAVLAKDMDAIRIFLTHDFEYKTKAGEIMLYYASIKKNMDLMKFIIDLGVDPTHGIDGK